MQNKKKLYIIGAGGFGRELESWLNEIPIEERDWELIGYIDDNPDALDNFPSDYKILGSIDNFNFNDDYVVVAIANPKIKETIYKKINGRVIFFTFISPKATIAKFVEIGEGSVICPNVVISTNIIIGKLTTINCATQIGHDCNIGDYSSLMPNVDIGGGCNIGKRVFMGTKSTIIPSRKIVDDVFIGAGAIVIRNIKKEGTFFGNPAIRIS